MKTISLCMIVKNESHVIKRCLDSVKPLIDYVFISDTGSTDDTIQTIRDWLLENNLPGEVVSHTWVNFAHNRSLALSELRNKEFIDYALMIDADEVLNFDTNFNCEFFKSNMDVDLYDIETSMGGVRYIRPQLSSNRKKFKYEGVVHEFLTGEFESRGKVVGFHNTPIQDSNRNRSGDKFERDVEILQKAIEETDDPWFKSRYTFYLAQSLRDLQRREESLKKYLERAQMGYWHEEIYVSYFNAATLMKELNYPNSEIIMTFMKGHESCATRGECIHGALQLCRMSGMNHFGYIIGKEALKIKKPFDSLFSEDWVYDYGILDEFSIVSFYTGNFEESKEACEKLIKDRKYPNFYHDRILSNLNYSTDRLK